MVKRTPSSGTRKVIKTINEIATELEATVVRFKHGDQSLDFNIDVTAKTVWATQQQIADLYGKDRRTIAEHIKNVFSEKELDEGAVCRKFRHTAGDGKQYEVLHYNLDMILSVGYRVSSKKATRFRQWATSILTKYIVEGYALNDSRLKDDPQALKKLAAEIRRLRNEEKAHYAAVRDCFARSAVDYDKDSDESRRFFAKLQDKFHYAVTSETACEIIIHRADHRKPQMGLQTFKGDKPQLSDATVGKNYLEHDELYVMDILSEQFLLYAESKAMRGQQMTMKELSDKFDELLKVNGYPVFRSYDKGYLRERADRHAKVEFALWSRGLTTQRPTPRLPPLRRAER
jgi:hypothetical protein